MSMATKSIHFIYLSLEPSNKMHSRSRISPASASRGSSPKTSNSQQQNEAVDKYPSNCRCDDETCKTRFPHRSDLFRRLEFGHARNQPPPFNASKIGNVEKVKEHMKNLYSALSPDAPGYESSSDTQSFQKFAVQGRDIISSAEDINIGGPSNLDDFDCYDESTYDTSYTSVASQADFTDSTNSNDFIDPSANPSTYLSGIGHWVDDRTSSESARTAWHNPNFLLQHASRFKATPLAMKPHVEEAIDCFRASFYGAGGAAEEHYIVEH
ncbi:hypothetical protein N431DRAFT_552606 [Stipitochalara longipes BDJ]|nr:hypothetical protein N431DRAFT_552606 [Stipitochalara longipes BDJ]